MPVDANNPDPTKVAGAADGPFCIISVMISKLLEIAPDAKLPPAKYEFVICSVPFPLVLDTNTLSIMSRAIAFALFTAPTV